MQQGMSPLSYGDKITFAGMFKLVNYKLLENLNPGADVELLLKDAAKQQDYMMKQWHKQPWLDTPEAPKSSRGKSKTKTPAEEQ